MLDRIEAYHLAIQNEVQSQNLYTVLAKAFASSPACEVFHRLVAQEVLHEDKLRLQFALEYPGHTIEVDRNLTPFMREEDLRDPKTVLEFAITREEAAAHAYEDLAAMVSAPTMQDMLLSLREEEEHHKAILQEQIIQLQGDLTWYDPSELNGLVED